jgi:hypothetical protein
MPANQAPAVDDVTLMDGEEVLHECHPHWSERENSVLHLFKPPLYVVTTERVIEHTPTWTGAVTDEYPIRDIQQLQTHGTNSFIDRFDIGSVSFSVGGAGDKITLDGVKEYDAMSDSIRERQREIADG